MLAALLALLLQAAEIKPQPAATQPRPAPLECTAARNDRRRVRDWVCAAGDDEAWNCSTWMLIRGSLGLRCDADSDEIARIAAVLATETEPPHRSRRLTCAQGQRGGMHMCAFDGYAVSCRVSRAEPGADDENEVGILCNPDAADELHRRRMQESHAGDTLPTFRR